MKTLFSIAFATAEKAQEGIEKIQTDWETHSHAARALAKEYFGMDNVPGSMMREIGLA